VARPRVLVGVQRVLDVLEHRQILKRLHARVDQLGELPRARAQETIGRQERRLRKPLLEIFDDGDRLREQSARARLFHLERRHLLERIDGAILGRELLAAVAPQIHRRGLVRHPFVVQRDAHPPARRRPPIRVELHASLVSDPTRLLQPRIRAC